MQFIKDLFNLMFEDMFRDWILLKKYWHVYLVLSIILVVILIIKAKLSK